MRRSADQEEGFDGAFERPHGQGGVGAVRLLSTLVPQCVCAVQWEDLPAGEEAGVPLPVVHPGFEGDVGVSQPAVVFAESGWWVVCYLRGVLFLRCDE